MTKLHLAPLCLLVACAGTGEPPSEPIAATTEPPPPDLVLDFAHSGQLKQFEYTSPRMWRPYQESLELLGKSPYEPPHRSPHSIALLRTEPLGDFVLETRALQTGREYGHRDLCLVFGFVDDANFYYAHLASTPDPRAHNVFLVDDADRVALAPVPDQGVDWGTDVWHDLKVERQGARIRVWFDGQLTHEVTDATHGAGRVGLGSFDDSGRFDDLRLTSPDL